MHDVEWREGIVRSGDKHNQIHSGLSVPNSRQATFKMHSEPEETI
jgi:hypothetical protein